MGRSTYMPVKEAEGNINKYMRAHVDRSEYASLVENECAWCGDQLDGGIERYEIRGNCCITCQNKARTYRMTEAQLDKALRDPAQVLEKEIFKDDTDYAYLKRSLRLDMQASDIEQSMLRAERIILITE